jgi:hypothetical protein
MAGSNRDQEKTLRKDQQAGREVRQDVQEEIRSSAAKPLIRQPNRDQARGDWDRTRTHQDVGASRAADEDEPFDERS